MKKFQEAHAMFFYEMEDLKRSYPNVVFPEKSRVL